MHFPLLYLSFVIQFVYSQVPAMKSKIPIIHSPLIETLEKAERAIKLSAKSPYDLSMLDNEMTNFNFGDDLAAITVSASGMCFFFTLFLLVFLFVDFQDQLKAIKKAVKDCDEFELERALRAIEKNVLAQIAVCLFCRLSM
jgi:hypothetical protein